MIEFKALRIEDKDIFEKYMGEYKFNTYEYSFLTLYLWRKYCNVEYAIIKDALVVKKTEDSIGSYFMQPIGYSDENLRDIISELIKVKRSDLSIKFLFRDIEEPFLYKLKELYGGNFLYFEDVKNFDYIYKTENLIKLEGEKLRKRRLQYNQFASRYNYSIKDIHSKAVIEDCLNFSKAWFESQKNVSRELVFERAGIKDILTNIDALDIIGMAVYIDGRIAGFTIGEQVNDQMAIIHIEKADIAYKGIYAFINRTFALEYLKDATYINREEDLGIAGLRKAKMAYDPIKLEKKYYLSFLRGII